MHERVVLYVRLKILIISEKRLSRLDSAEQVKTS